MSVKEVINFRNLIAHGKEEIVKFKGKTINESPAVNYSSAIQGKWEKFCTPAHARRAFDGVNTETARWHRPSGHEEDMFNEEGKRNGGPEGPLSAKSGHSAKESLTESIS
jgi:hypothetical protein